MIWIGSADQHNKNERAKNPTYYEIILVCRAALIRLIADSYALLVDTFGCGSCICGDISELRTVLVLLLYQIQHAGNVHVIRN